MVPTIVSVNTNANSQNATWRGTASLLRWAALWDSAGAEIQWDWVELAGAPWERC